MSGKAACKKALQEELGLAVDPDKPLVAMVGRLTEQKGIGLVVAGHWGTEHAIADVLAVQLEKQFPALTVAHAEADADPYSYLL